MTTSMTPAALREKLGLTQLAMGKALGVSRATWVRIETATHQQTGAAVVVDRRTRLALAALAAGLKPL